MSRLEPVDPSLRHVHRAMPHDSAFKHVQGAADYIDDMLEPEGTLHVAIGGSPAARGRIIRLDLGPVRPFPGVHAVITGNDVPGKNDISPTHADEPAFATERVMFHGQPIFAVIATTRDIARRAATLAVIDVERERANVTVEQGLGSGEPFLMAPARYAAWAAASAARKPRRRNGPRSPRSPRTRRAGHASCVSTATTT